ncbi:MAG TPA: TIGR00730 family Rossman fold protein [Bacteroidales bacterium]|nr:MAG: Rossman fold protein, TIGR00730 family [Bacteroidetes bacterium GWF2_33_38]OFY74935.1 MAG: Rossman fold protein, TIGR00730 family [Bacteroidetes bacterium RIFOXYA12_FULL_33_9]OFY90846.1 MAG: Rossman fold protein, TIGR00730 family [Bacteroidetes bacterium RIFOXYA2_FULL_33_7]HBF89494.1 TIGR00730 family Rossman fold protein [Bacteroidales bacterium]
MPINICLFCSSSDSIHQEYFKIASEVGEIIGLRTHTLVHGGGKIGLMGEVARNTQKHGGKVLGIIPEKLKIKGVVSETDDELIITPDMHTRKEMMRSKADAFITLPGGFGTFEEILEVITLKQLKYHEKPIVFVNTRNYFEHLFLLFEKSFEEKFALADFRQLYFVTESPKEAIDYIENYKAVDIRDKWL